MPTKPPNKMDFKAKYEREGTPGWMIDSWEAANHLLGYQKANGPSYTIFTLEDTSYIQVAGEKKRLTVEARIVNKDRSFNHFRFGKGRLKNESETIDCNVGPIEVDSSQILTMKDARILIREFVESRTFNKKYEASEMTDIF